MMRRAGQQGAPQRRKKPWDGWAHTAAPEASKPACGIDHVLHRGGTRQKSVAASVAAIQNARRGSSASGVEPGSGMIGKRGDERGCRDAGAGERINERHELARAKQ